MKAVVYFAKDDVEKAREVMARLKVDGVNVHWAGAEEFQDPRDVESVDEVHLVSDAPHIERAYKSRDIKVVKAGSRSGKKKISTSLNPLKSDNDKNEGAG